MYCHNYVLPLLCTTTAIYYNYYVLPQLCTTTTATAAAGWASGINGRLNHMFLNMEFTGSIPGEEHGEI